MATDAVKYACVLQKPLFTFSQSVQLLRLLNNLICQKRHPVGVFPGITASFL